MEKERHPWAQKRSAAKAAAGRT
ncbi:MAG: hypothetical protein QOJ60_376, partial [Actinomycetota bacterium]|nr:hypothetical protein [Actinomycetota bacterium]